MKFIIIKLLLLIVLNIENLISCQDITIFHTNYTRNALLNIEKEIKCVNDGDCPLGSTCNKENYCYFEFLCPNNEEKPCVSLNITNYESYNKNKDSRKPIIEACNEDYIGKNYFTKLFAKCYTSKCEVDKDCYSGLCLYNTCVSVEPIYKCAGSFNGHKNIYCGKDLFMKCDKSEECFSNYCEGDLCKNEIMAADISKGLILFVFIVIPLAIIIRRIVVSMRSKNKYMNLKVKDSD